MEKDSERGKKRGRKMKLKREKTETEKYRKRHKMIEKERKW